MTWQRRKGRLRQLEQWWPRCGCFSVCHLLRGREAQLQLSGLVPSLCVPWLQHFDICDDGSAESPQTTFACIACLLMLREESNYGTFGFKGQNLPQTSLGCVVITTHGNFRDPESRKAGPVRKESRDGMCWGPGTIILSGFIWSFSTVHFSGGIQSVSHSVSLSFYP